MNRPQIKLSRTLIRTAAAVIIIAAAAAFLSLGGMMSNAVAVPGSVFVPTGADYAQLSDSLEGRLRKPALFQTVARIYGLPDAVRPGRYVLPERINHLALVKMFRRGLQTPVKLTFNNIRTVDRLAGALSRQVEPDSIALLSAFNDPVFIEKYGFTPQTFIAMFIPNTYEIYWNSSPEALCDRMKKEYNRFWDDDRRAKAESMKLTPVQVATLASIVYEETKMSDEMPRVAGVYINRLRIGMPLQADPTLKFAAGDFSLRRILDRHKLIDSPYNTYMYRGLPPGPICMPSIKALDAVLGHERHNYVYFCAAPDFSGYHRFATNLAGHEQNRQQYIRFLNANGIR